MFKLNFHFLIKIICLLVAKFEMDIGSPSGWKGMIGVIQPYQV